MGLKQIKMPQDFRSYQDSVIFLNAPQNARSIWLRFRVLKQVDSDCSSHFPPVLTPIFTDVILILFFFLIHLILSGQNCLDNKSSQKPYQKEEREGEYRAVFLINADAIFSATYYQLIHPELYHRCHLCLCFSLYICLPS